MKTPLTLGLELTELATISRLLGLNYSPNLLYSAPFAYTLDENGNTLLTNQGSNGATNDLLLSSGRAAELGATNDLAIPIHHTLGAELFTDFIQGETTASTNNRFWQRGNGYPWEIGKTYRIEIDYNDIGYDALLDNQQIIIISSQDAVFTRHKDSRFVIGGSGTVFAEFTIDSGTDPSSVNFIYFFVYSNAPSVVSSFASFEVKEITSMANSFLTYHDIANDEIIQIGNAVDGGSSKELVSYGDFSNPTDCSNISTVSSRALFDCSSGSLIITKNPGASGWLDTYFQNIDIELGKSYAIELDVINIYQTNYQGTYENSVRISLGQNAVYFNGIGRKRLVTYSLTSLSKGITMASNDDGDTFTIDNISVKEILPTSTEYILNDVTVNNILKAKQMLDDASIANIKAEPNKLAELGINRSADGVNVTLDADDSYYAVSEVSGAYVVDQRDSGTDVIDWNDWGTLVGVTVDISDEIMYWDTDASGYISDLGALVNLPKDYLVVVKVTNYVQGVFNVRSGNYAFSSWIDANGTYIGVLSATQAELRLYGGGTGFTGDVKIQVIEDASYSEIANYTETIRTNANQLPNGLQTTALVLDGAGVPTAYTESELMVYDDTLVDTQFIPNMSEYSIEESVSGELQDFGGEVSKQATSVNTNWTDNGDGTYTGNGGNGFVSIIVSQPVTTGYSIIKITDYVSGTVSLPYTGSGARQEKSGNGVHFGVANIGVNGYIFGTAFEGTVEVLSIKELTTKTQRTEKRLLTHGTVLGVECLEDSEFDIGDGWGLGGAWVIAGGVATHDTGQSAEYLSSYCQGLFLKGRTYIMNIVILEGIANLLSVHYSVGSGVYGVGTHTIKIVPKQSYVYFYSTGVKTVFDRVSFKEVSTETKYYIGTDGGARVEQAVVPPLPDDATSLKLTNTPIIGYADTIDEINYFEVNEKIIIP